MIYYKIRSKATKLYRCAGGMPKWNKSGKVFDSLGKLRSMISNCMNYNDYDWHSLKNDFSDWEIIEYEVIEKDVKHVADIISKERLFKILKD